MSKIDTSCGMRGEVVEFALAMERELQANEHKGGWHDCSLPWLLNRLRQEAAELRAAIEAGKSPDEVLGEAADVANFALMIADVYRRLKKRP